jgi:hypothetical protein
LAKSPQKVQKPETETQLMLAFPGKVQLEPKQRAQVVALLSRLLLQAAKTKREVADDTP